MKRISGMIALAAAALMLSCGGGKYEYPFQNPKLKVDKRVDNLMSLLTPEEKVGLIMNKSVSVDRLGIPSYMVVRGLPRSTSGWLHRIPAAYRYGCIVQRAAGL